MKNVFMVFIIVMVGCSIPDKDHGLAGVYTGKFEHEFAKNDDTLIIKKANDGRVFQISRHTGMRRIEDGVISAKKTIIEDFIAEFDADNKILTELNEGRKFVWDRKTQTILSGKTWYNKKAE